jgi:hypothetical protein
MKVFLSGKIDREAGAWRDQILGVRWNAKAHKMLPEWVIPPPRPKLSEYDYGDLVVAPWPISKGVVLGRYDYVGPYRQEDDELNRKYAGDFHGTTARGQHGSMDSDVEDEVVLRCRQAILNADLVFAYVNRPDAFGTLVEIGYAAALGKYLLIYVDEEARWDWGDYWFAEKMASSRIYLRERADGLAEGEKARLALEQGILNFASASRTALEPRPPMIPEKFRLLPGNGPSTTADASIVQSFSQIARWSSDPRVRDEATRMLRRLQAEAK